MQQYVVETKLTINSHAVTVEEIEYLETVERNSYEPYFIDKPQPAEYIGKGTVLPLTVLYNIESILCFIKGRLHYRQKCVVSLVRI